MKRQNEILKIIHEKTSIPFFILINSIFTNELIYLINNKENKKRNPRFKNIFNEYISGSNILRTLLK